MGELLSKITGGIITAIPTSMEDAKKMLSSLMEVIKQKVAEMMQKAGGALGKLGKALGGMKGFDLSKLIPKPIMDFFKTKIKAMLDGVVKDVKSSMQGNSEGAMFGSFGNMLSQ